MGRSFFAPLKHDTQLSPIHGIMALENGEHGWRGERTRLVWRLVEEYGPESFTVEPEGTLLFRWGFPDVEGLLGWVLTFGDGAELLEPVELRDSLAQLLRRALSHYE